MIYFEQLGKYLSQLVLLLKSLRDGAGGQGWGRRVCGGRARGGVGKSIPPSEDGDMMHAERAATPGHRTDQSGQLKAS